jgi:hypothetical protein
LSLSDQQKEVFDLVTKRRCQFIKLDGSAGTGKSYLIDQLRRSEPALCVVAPTGRAASNVRGETLFRQFGVPSQGALDPGEKITLQRSKQIETRFFGRKRDKLLQQISWLIIEEYTMVRADHIDFISKAMTRATANPEPFGGKRVMFVGGPGQLLPVSTEDDAKALSGYGYEEPFGLEQSKFWENHSDKVQVRSLNHIFRQSKPIEANILERVKVGRQTDMDLRELNKRVGKAHPSAIVLSPYRKRAAQINEQKLSELRSREYVFIASNKGDTKGLDAMEQTLTLREGCRVIIKKNIRKKIRGEVQSVVNGDTGTFVGMDKYERLVIMRDRDSEYVYISREKDVKFKNRIGKGGEIDTEEVGSMKQYPVRLGWAMTIHSSQGLTLERVHLELGYKPITAWGHGLAYVALSRITNFSGLTINRALTHRDICSTIKSFQHPEQQYEL